MGGCRQNLRGNPVLGKECPEFDFDEEIKVFMDRWNIPGGTVALVKNGDLVYNQAYGKAEEKVAMNTKHVFRIASLSKPITATAIMLLVDRGALQLDEQVFGRNGILNDRKFSCIIDPRAEEITVRHLLQHRGGWDRMTSCDRDPMFQCRRIGWELGLSGPAGQEDIIEYMLGKPLDFRPGARFAYSNLGYCILGRIIEKISGMTYDNFVRRFILQPIGIDDMQLGKNEYNSRTREEVWYYEGVDQDWLPASERERSKNKFTYAPFDMSVLDSACGWVASASSIARLLAALNQTEGRTSILGESVSGLFAADAVSNKNYGLGWFIHQDEGGWSHHGCIAGTSAMMYRSKSGLSWVVLFNSWPDTPSYFQSLEKMMKSAVAHWEESNSVSHSSYQAA